MDNQELLQKLRETGNDADGAVERFVGDEELYVSCLRSFMDDDNFVLLERALLAEDHAQAFAAAHTLKGVAGNLGLTPLYKSVCVLVESLRTDRLDTLRAEYDDVALQYGALRALIGGESHA